MTWITLTRPVLGAGWADAEAPRLMRAVVISRMPRMAVRLDNLRTLAPKG